MKNKELIENSKVLFRIAGHSVEVVLLPGKDWKKMLPSFAPFRCWHADNEEPIFSMETVNSLGYLNLASFRLLVESSQIIGAGFRLLETNDRYIVDIQYVKGGAWHRMLTDKTFKSVKVHMRWGDPYVGNVLNAFIMIAFAQSAVVKQTVLVHASAVENNDRGFAFLGRSGIGKSTHSALWMEYIKGTQLLNDDNPAIRVEDDGGVYIYGTPWSGKKPCYRNVRVPLAALVRLEQASENCVFRHSDAKALMLLLPSCSSMRWNDALYKTLCDVLEIIIDRVSVFSLACLPCAEAALLCYDEIKKKSI